MGCGNLFFLVLVTFSVALITYNIIISANVPLKQELPGPSRSSSSITVDPVIKMPMSKSKTPSSKRLFHTAVTASDSVYNTWQCRIMYYWFKKFKDGPNSEMGGFTRILHSGKPDKYMDEIPTFVAQPLPAGMDRGYIVLNRPWAFVQWLQQADIKEDYILMSEPDHIIVKPIPNLSKDGLGAAFPFFYIEPKKYESQLRKFFPENKGPITNIDPIGNSPVIVQRESLKKIAPTWMNISLAMKKDPETDNAFGWVLEMYAYAVASALHDVGNILYKDFMLQVLSESLLLFIILVYTQHSICIHSHCCLISLFSET
ncbi:hydroxyproline O-arabinosyltransferase 1-like isoform X2 [Cucurbita maxima]|uniref:Hydroxyproline O-arabinosyltransferase 1-like isoform X2 n=1 Tax=Cucurbita maxima TaxID=3661 RepID=A0A6J1K991_CUCMA|nr:hydroxyproline O-arabinosyltransferase 1-like isoform X2 [Cucurbita maxima]